MDIGDKIYFKQKDLYVNQYEAKLHKGDLIYKYRFCRDRGIWIDKIYNKKIKGVSIEGKVLETAGEKLKIHLNIDESQDPSKAELAKKIYIYKRAFLHPINYQQEQKALNP